MLELLGAVDRFGYAGISTIVFIESFGIPAPGETAIIAGAAYAGRGHLNIFVVALAAFVAAAVGDSVGYWIGRRGGRPLLLRFGRYVRLTSHRLDRVESFMSRHGPKMVVVARFVEGLRQFNGVVAGSTRMPFGRFLVWNVLGAALWVGCWSTAGYFAGDHLEEIATTVSRYLVVAVALAAAVLLAYFWRKRRSRRRTAES
ncbi:membrane protein DedA with SNARE-associated domain [Actinoplanes tereljensis]|uniref:Membrane protein n=1 Tax=Paractinoplanes tereljensis TaxID=571912 RepID=A0A919NRW0_9ACTN|nr:DedA family protein [Actinoplanes tereljensis]GIF22682.1 membrane protein [Actinoplanes tereljensis]